MRPPKLAIRAAMGGLFAAAVLGMGAVSASAAPNPGPGTGGSDIQTFPTNAPDLDNNTPTYPSELMANGPQTANVPTLAWVGEEVRLVACDQKIRPLPFDVYQQAHFASDGGTEWTGDPLYHADVRRHELVEHLSEQRQAGRRSSSRPASRPPRSRKRAASRPTSSRCTPASTMSPST